MAEFTREQLIAQAQSNVRVLKDAGMRLSGGSEIARIHLRLAEIALAALTAEPVVYRNKDTGSVCNANWLGDHSPASLGFEPLYRLPEIE